MNKRLVPIIFAHDGKMDLSRQVLNQVFPDHQFQSKSLTGTRDFFCVRPAGRYNNPGFPFACRNPLPINDQLELCHRIVYHPDYDVEFVFGINFGGHGEPSVLFGELQDPQSVTRSFIPADIYEDVMVAPHVLVRVNWDRKFPNTSGHLVDIIKPLHFHRNTDNSGLRGTEHWVMSFQDAKCDLEHLRAFRWRHAMTLPTEAQAQARLERFIGRTLLSYCGSDPERTIGKMFLTNCLYSTEK